MENITNKKISRSLTLHRTWQHVKMHWLGKFSWLRWVVKPQRFPDPGILPFFSWRSIIWWTTFRRRRKEPQGISFWYLLQDHRNSLRRFPGLLFSAQTLSAFRWIHAVHKDFSFSWGRQASYEDFTESMAVIPTFFLRYSAHTTLNESSLKDGLEDS